MTAFSEATRKLSDKLLFVSIIADLQTKGKTDRELTQKPNLTKTTLGEVKE
jgi:hypothetical protein